MAVVSWTIANADLNRLIDALAFQYGYQPFLNPPDNTIPNPETKPNFVHRMVGVEWRRRTVLYERTLSQNSVPTPIEPDIT